MKYDPNFIRNHAPGYVGGREVTDRATDEELCLLEIMNDELAALHNAAIPIRKVVSALTQSITGRV